MFLRIIRNKSLVLLFIVTLAVHKPYAQLYVGARAGYSISNVGFVPTKYQRPVFGAPINFGVVVKYFDLQYFGVQSELNLVQRGFRYTLDDYSNYKRISTYIELPMVMQIRVKHKKSFAHFNAGASVAYLLGAVHGNNSEGTYNMTTYHPNILNDIYFDYGVLGGLGFGYEFKFGTLQAEMSYYHGFGDVYNHKYTEYLFRSPARIQNISFFYLYNISQSAEKRKEKKTKTKKQHFSP